MERVRILILPSPAGARGSAVILTFHRLASGGATKRYDVDLVRSKDYFPDKLLSDSALRADRDRRSTDGKERGSRQPESWRSSSPKVRATPSSSHHIFAVTLLCLCERVSPDSSMHA